VAIVQHAGFVVRGHHASGPVLEFVEELEYVDPVPRAKGDEVHFPGLLLDIEVQLFSLA
jgi:hypothetical protein